jgi:Bacterial aa3 type cytochrome c oxidase subunit IV
MADTEAQRAGHPAMDYEEHEKTCRMFLRFTKYSLAAVAALLVLLAALWG